MKPRFAEQLVNQSRLLETEETFFAHNHVIKYANAENFRGLFKLLLRFQIVVAGFHVARRMVVSKDDSGGAIGDYVGENIPRMNQAPIEQADCHHTFFDYLVRAV